MFMKLFAAAFFFALMSVSLDVHAKAWVGAEYCQPTLEQCLKKNKGSTKCGDEYESCLTTKGGVLERSDGSMTQMYHPDNPQFKKCQSQGLIIGTKAFTACMNGANTTVASTPTRPASTTNPDLASTPTAATTPEAEQDVNTPESRACQSEFSEVYSKCQAESQIAVATCDVQNDLEMTAFEQTVNQATAVAAQQSAAIMSSCADMMRLSQNATTTVTAFKTRCQSAQTSCYDSCARLKTFIAERGRSCFPHLDSAQVAEAMAPYDQSANTNRSTCEALTSRITEATKAVNEYGTMVSTSALCRDQTDGLSAGNGLPAVCRTDPNDPSCKPTSANCSEGTCPDSSSRNEMAASNASGSGGAYGDAGSRGPQSGRDGNGGGGSGSGSGGGPDFGGGPGFAMTPGKPSGGNTGSVTEGRQGGEAALASASGNGRGGSGSANNGMRAPEMADGSNDHSVIIGIYGGGQGGSAYGGAKNANGAAVAGMGGAGRNPSSAELQKFLPGGQKAQRYINGASGPDGITGPHSNIWMKIQNRYQSESSNLMP